MNSTTTLPRSIRGLLAIALALAALGLSQPAAQAQLLTNGSFETVTPSPGASAYAADASTVLDGWTLNGNGNLGNIYIANSWAGISPKDGSVYVCLKFGASVSQTFSSAGGPATLTLNYYNMTQVGVSPHWADLIWSLNGVDIGNTASGTVKTWASASTVVTLLAGSNTLRIRQSPSSKGDVMCLDNVKLEATASPPPAPTGLAATAGNAQVALTWTASSGATGYNVKRSTTSGSGYATIGSPTGTSYTDTTAANGSTYYYVVSATNIIGEGANSSEVNATPSLPPPPPAPTGLTAPAGNASVPLIWTASSGATSYTVKRSTTSGSGYATLGTPSGTSYIDSTAANGTTYYYVVSASNAGGEGVNSSEVSATPSATASLVANGSFEIVSPSPATGTSYAANASTVLAGWTLGAGASSEGLGCIYIANYWAGNIHPTDGSIYTCLKFGASLSQTFNAPTSGNYTLTFDYYEADNMFGGTNDATTALQWYMDGSLIANSIGSKVNGWVSQSHTLPLTAGPHTFMLKHNNSSSGDVICLDNVKLLAAPPTIAATGSPLSAMSSTYGTASTATPFSVSGTNMAAGITVTPPTGLEVSTTSATTGFQGSGTALTVGSSGTIASTTVYVRLAATAAVSGSYNSQNIVLSSSGATSVNVVTAASGNTVGKAAQTITFGTLVAKTVGDAPSALTATASSGLAVSYVSSAPGVASVAGSTVTSVAAGTTHITASQAGDDNHNAATSVTQALTVMTTAFGTQYNGWVSGSTSLTGAAANPDADPDSDGVTNMMEYALGTNPQSGSSGTNAIAYEGASVTAHGQPIQQDLSPGTGGVDFRAVFGRRKDASSAGLIYTMQFSADNSHWENSTATQVDVLASDSTIEAVSVPYPLFIPMTGGGYKKPTFFRVGVSTSN